MAVSRAVDPGRLDGNRDGPTRRCPVLSGRRKGRCPSSRLQHQSRRGGRVPWAGARGGVRVDVLVGTADHASHRDYGRLDGVPCWPEPHRAWKAAPETRSKPAGPRVLMNDDERELAAAL